MAALCQFGLLQRFHRAARGRRSTMSGVNSAQRRGANWAAHRPCYDRYALGTRADHCAPTFGRCRVKAVWRRWCGTHSPDAKHPGIISDNLTKDFAAEGYPLKTRTIETPSLIEVYPHPALLELMSASMRLPYKVGKQRTYWKEVSPAERRQRLVEQWTAIVDAIDARIAGIRTGLEIPLADAPIRALKSFEDRLDAVICALVGACALTGHAKPWGDDHSAIWIPSSGLGPG